MGRGGFGSPNSSSSEDESASSSDEDESAAGSTKDGSGMSSPSIEMVGLFAAGDVPACGGEAAERQRELGTRRCNPVETTHGSGLRP